MATFFTIIHIITSILLVLIILLQIGKAGTLGNIFGGGGSDQLFSTPSGSDFLRKITIGLAILFIITSLGLTFLGYRRGLRTVTGIIPPTSAQQAQQPAPQTK